MSRHDILVAASRLPGGTITRRFCGGRALTTPPSRPTTQPPGDLQQMYKRLLFVDILFLFLSVCLLHFAQYILANKDDF